MGKNILILKCLQIFSEYEKANLIVLSILQRDSHQQSEQHFRTGLEAIISFGNVCQREPDRLNKHLKTTGKIENFRRTPNNNKNPEKRRK